MTKVTVQHIPHVIHTQMVIRIYLGYVAAGVYTNIIWQGFADCQRLRQWNLQATR